MSERVALSLVWFCVLGGIGTFFPFYSLYLRENAGLTGSQVGAVAAVLPMVGMLAQPFWGQVADRTGSRTRVLVVLTLGAATGYAALGLPSTFAGFLVATALLAFFSTPLVPSCVAVTLATLRDPSGHGFGRVRVWGTLGFLVLVVSFPRVLDRIQAATGRTPVEGGPSEPGLGLMFPVTGAVVALGALVALAIPRTGAAELRAERREWRLLLRHGPFVRLLVFAFAMYATLQGPMVIFPVFVRAHGGDLSLVSNMWILMLALEIPLVFWTGASVARFGPRGVIAAGMLAGALRWTVCGFADDLAWIVPVQILHGVVVWGIVIGTPLYAEAVVPEQLRSTAQGLLAMLGVSLGGIVSNLGAGWLLEHVGPDAAYQVGGAGAFVLALLVPLALPPPRRHAGRAAGEAEAAGAAEKEASRP